jgi:ABC-type transport system involved in multi-copper enzyme maturation permease subunit
MTTDLVTLILSCSVLVLIQLLAALPWLAAVDSRTFFTYLRRPESYVYGLIGVVVAGAGAALFLQGNTDRGTLAWYGGVYGAVLQVQLTADLFVLVFAVALTLWPKGGAVAHSAFRESLRQPMFWLLFFVALIMMWIFPFLPYFTLGEDIKMVKELGYDLIMLVAVVFAVIAASSSISEEIEGRTAVTLMSKPVSRRQFLLGKFLGIFMGAMVMATLLGWFLVMMFLFKENYDPPLGSEKNRVSDPAWVSRFIADYVPEGEPAGLVRGVGLWFDHSGAVLPGLVIVSGQVMILLAIAVALATRLPMVVTIPICIVFYFLGHLTPILISVSRGKGGAFRLIEFMAQVFDTILPGLEHFSLGAVIVRDAPLPAGQFALYTSEVSLYALLYTAIALLFGLILFEDRDLA